MTVLSLTEARAVAPASAVLTRPGFDAATIDPLTVTQWCRDGHDATLYSHGPAVNPCNEPLGIAGRRVSRGASFMWTLNGSSSAARLSHPPETVLNNVGVRPARAVAGEIGSRAEEQR